MAGGNEERLPRLLALVPYLQARPGISVEQATENLLIEKQPSKQFATPEQMGELAAFLASDAAAYCHGGVHPVDGGWLGR